MGIIGVSQRFPTAGRTMGLRQNCPREHERAATTRRSRRSSWGKERSVGESGTGPNSPGVTLFDCTNTSMKPKAQNDRVLRRRSFEYNVVGCVLENLAGVPYRSWDSAFPPEPDVVIELHDSSRIGVEVTEVHPGGEDLRLREAEHDGILNDALARYKAMGLPGVGVRLHWNGSESVQKRVRADLAHSIATFVSKNIPPLFGEVIVDQSDDIPPALPAAVDTICISRNRHDADFWHSPRGAWVPDCDPTLVQKRLSAKKEKPQQYVERYNELWLVVVMGGAGPSTWGNIPDGIGDHVFTSTYARNFLLRIPGPIAELKVVGLPTPLNVPALQR